MTEHFEKLEVQLNRLPTSDGDWVDVLIRDHNKGSTRLEDGASIGIVHVHGKGGNFYGLPFRPVALPLERALGDASKRILQVSVNMRCHDLGYTRTDVPSADSVVQADVDVGGGMWEDTSLGTYDIEAAVNLVRSAGCARIFLLGHSAGGFYAAAYSATDPDLAGLVLLSPLTSNKTNLKRWFPDPGDLEAALDNAHRMVDSGKGHHLIPIPAWYYAISARTFIQRVTEANNVWTDNLNVNKHPLLVMWGDQESRGPLFSSLVNNLDSDSKKTLEISDCEHNYIGHSEHVASEVSAFIKAHSP